MFKQDCFRVYLKSVHMCLIVFFFYGCVFISKKGYCRLRPCLGWCVFLLSFKSLEKSNKQEKYGLCTKIGEGI